MSDSDRPVSTMVEIQCLLDNVGTSELVIDLIVNTKNDRVFEESILLGIALLQGGNTQIQVSSDVFAESRVLEARPGLSCPERFAPPSPSDLLLQPAVQAEEVGEVLQGLLRPHAPGSAGDQGHRVGQHV